MTANAIPSQNRSFLTRLLRGEGVPLSPQLRYTSAGAIFVSALAARFAMLPVESGLGFLTFYPAVALTALLFGTGPGLLIIALGALSAHYFFMPPYWAFKLDLGQILSVATFGFSGAIICFVTHQMRQRAQELKVTLTALELREEELARANRRLESLDRAKTEFFSNVSHEFRTPLTLILGPLESLLAQPLVGQIDEIASTIKLVRRNAVRLLRLVNALLDYSQLEAGRAQPQWTAVNLSSYTAELASNFQSACEQGGLKLIVDCPAVDQHVMVDQGMWEKIVLNLLSNAFKFTQQGEICVQMRENAQEVILTVRDTGAGIAPEDLPHIFERFYRVHGVLGRSVEGSGIGLALTAELVRLHGGTISVESQKGQGCTFTVRIPREGGRFAEKTGPVRVDSDEGLVNDVLDEIKGWLPDRAEVEALLPVQTKGRVILADDNQDMRGYIKRLLQAGGYAVEAVDRGDIALARCQAQRPDLVLSDVMMPGLDGFQLLGRLRSAPDTATLPVILLSARAGEEARVEGLTAGADDYLVKPFGARELMARVDGAMKLAALRELAQALQRQYMSELERSNQSLLDFAYAASHDLKEPLRGLHNYTTFLKEDYANCLGTQGNDYINQMQRLVARLTTLIDGLLSYSKLGASAMHVESVALDQVANEVIEDLRPFLDGMNVKVARPTALPTVRCDALLVRAIYQNLITNAAKYNDKADRLVEIGAKPSHPPVLFVRDNGIGIAPQHLTNIFRIFTRLHEPDKFGGGTGVGLSIVKKLVDRHGGRIWLESEPGVGTTVYFTLEGEG